MIGEVPLVQPSPPEVRGPAHARGRVLIGERRVAVGPRESDEFAITLLHLVECERRAPLEPHAHAGRQAQDGIVLAAVRHGLAVARARVLPCSVVPAVVEHRLAVHLNVDATVDAAELPHQHVLGDVVGRGTTVGPDAAIVAPRPHDQRVAHHQPAGARVPRGLEDVGAGDVATPRRSEELGRAQAERAGASIQDRAEHARSVRSRQTKPLDVPARRDERRDLTVGDEAVVRDRRERAGAARGRCQRRGWRQRDRGEGVHAASVPTAPKLASGRWRSGSRSVRPILVR